MLLFKKNFGDSYVDAVLVLLVMIGLGNKRFGFDLLGESSGETLADILERKD